MVHRYTEGVSRAFMLLWLITLPDLIYANKLPFISASVSNGIHVGIRRVGANEEPATGCKGLEGRKKYLIADNANMLAICHECGPYAVPTVPDSVSVHGKYGDSFAKWILEPVGDKCALKSAHSEKYAARCNGCFKGGSQLDSVFAWRTKASTANPETLWVVEKHNLSYSFKADNGMYMARCQGCAPNTGDNAFTHQNSWTHPTALWRVLPA